jgi:hypothetical protein
VSSVCQAQAELGEMKKEVESLRAEKEGVLKKLDTLESANERLIDMKVRKEIIRLCYDVILVHLFFRRIWTRGLVTLIMYPDLTIKAIVQPFELGNDTISREEHKTIVSDLRISEMTLSNQSHFVIFLISGKLSYWILQSERM